MSDPRYTDPNDPRYLGPQSNDPALRPGMGGPWGWIIGLAVVVLLGFVIVAGFNGNSHTASNVPPPANSSPTHSTAPPLGTTGQGGLKPAPAPAPAPAKPSGGTQ